MTGKIKGRDRVAFPNKPLSRVSIPPRMLPAPMDNDERHTTTDSPSPIGQRVSLADLKKPSQSQRLPGSDSLLKECRREPFLNRKQERPWVTSKEVFGVAATLNENQPFGFTSFLI